MTIYGKLKGNDYFGFYTNEDESLYETIGAKLTTEEHMNIINYANENNKSIVPDENNYPTFIDYEISEEEQRLEEISELKSYLKETDYIPIKIMEGVATKEEYIDELEKRQRFRQRINELETIAE